MLDQSDPPTRRAVEEFAQTARVTSARLTQALAYPATPKVHCMALAAYSAYLAELHGWSDQDYLRR